MFDIFKIKDTLIDVDIKILDDFIVILVEKLANMINLDCLSRKRSMWRNYSLLCCCCSLSLMIYLNMLSLLLSCIFMCLGHKYQRQDFEFV
ncbi:Uncharacterised protein [Porphyromonas cangingivalis]|nr:Uncharacterised protein [Porphyromonas cangingivalis]